MSKCINKSHPEFIKIANKIGELNTTYLWIINDFNFPSEAQVNDFIEKQKQESDITQDLIKEFNKVNLDNEVGEYSVKKAHEFGVQYQLPQNREIEEFVASEKTIRDLAARMSDRIGIPVKFESDRSKEYKGKLENNQITPTEDKIFDEAEFVNKLLDPSKIESIEDATAIVLYFENENFLDGIENIDFFKNGFSDNLIDITRLEKGIKDRPDSKRAKRKYNKAVKENNDIKKDAFIELVKKKYKTEQEQSFIDKLISIIKSYLSNNKALGKFDEIADNIIRNYKEGDITLPIGEIKDNYVKINFEKVVNNSEIASYIIEKLKDLNFSLTGSLAYSPFGNVYRDESNIIHDIDTRSDKSRTEVLESVKTHLPNSTVIYDISRKNNPLMTFIVPPENHSISNIKRKGADASVVIGYDVVNSKKEIVGSFKLDYEEDSAGKIIDREEIKTGVEATFLDVFYNISDFKKSSKEYTYTNSKGNKITTLLTDAKSGFVEKYKLSREKDKNDILLFSNQDESSTDTYYQKTSKEDKISLEEFEWQRSQLKTKLNAEIVFDNTLKESAQVKKGNKTNTITVNPNLIFSDTLVHEIGHIFIDAVGGLENPMIAQGVKQLRGTQLEADVRTEYSEYSETIIKKEILSTAIGMEAAQIFKGKKNLIDKFNNWLTLFYDRIRQVFGLSPNVAREIARQIINTPGNLSSVVEDIYYKKVKNIQLEDISDVLKRISNRIEIQLKRYASILEKGNELQTKQMYDLQNLLTELQKNDSKKAVVDYIYKASSMAASVTKRIDKIAALDENGDMDLNQAELIQIEEYIKAYQDIDIIMDQIKDDPAFSDVIDELTPLSNKTIAEYKGIESRILNLYKLIVIQVAMESDNSPTYLKFQSDFGDEFDKKNGNNKFFASNRIGGKKMKASDYKAERDRYVNQRLAENKKIIQARELTRLKDIMSFLPSDINFTDLIYETGYINEDFIQIATQLIANQQDIYRAVSIQIEHSYNDIFEEFHKENPESNQIKKYDALLDDELDMNGNPTGNKIPFLKGEFNASYYVNLNKLKAEENEALEAWDNDPTNKDLEKEHKAKMDARVDWNKANTKKYGSGHIVADKWRNKIERTPAEEKMYQFLLKSRANTQENYTVRQGELDIVRFGGAVTFHQIPAMNKESTEAIQNNKPGEILKHWFNDKFKVRSDDTEFRSSGLAVGDEDNNITRTQPVYYRRKVEDQSYDLLTLHMLDEAASIKYKTSRMIVPTLEIMKKVASQRNVGVTEGILGRGVKKIKNVYSSKGNQQDLIIPGIETKSYRVLESLVGATMYGDRHFESEKVAKIIGSIVGITSSTIMTFNLFSAVPNLLQGRVSNYIESHGLAGVSKDSALKADAQIAADIHNVFMDIGKIRPKSKTMLLMELMNPEGGFFGPSGKFSEDNKAKQIWHGGIAYSMSSMGEFFVHNGIMYGVMNDTKLLNKDNKFIDIEGKVTDDVSKAASLVDYISVVDGVLAYDADGVFKNVSKTTFSNKEIGPELISDVSRKLRDIAISTQGNYSADLWVYAQKYAAFKAVESLRKWMIPNYEKRFRGFGSAFDDNDTNRVLYSRRRGDIMSGNYVDSMRFARSMGKSLRKLKFDMIRTDWEGLSSRERANIRKTVAEAGVVTSLMIITYALSQLRNIEDEKDKAPDTLIFIIFALTRLQSEMAFYVDIRETYNLLNSPAASISMVARYISLLDQLKSDVTNWEFEEYEAGRHRGKSKLKKKIYDVLPGFSQLNRDVATTLSYFENPVVR